jgi:class 3 adenylate cyclase/tetratricopeptide (TPR) repeat protein
MRCPRCQHENPEGTKFCAQCAAPLAAGCPACGAANPPGNRFCGQCAAPLTFDSRGKFAGPDAYTPKHLAEKILTTKAALEGERKQVTVLFADLKGSMELLADRDPEEARKLLDPVLERMMEAVHHYEGTVNQVMGDGIMALFGAPVAHEDHAVRACYAALRMQRRVNLYADEVQQQGGTPVQIRVGVNSGEVVVRAISNDLHMDYTAVGQTTHLAARMEQMAKPGSALVTGDTLKRAEGFVQVRLIGAVPVKGLETPTPVYELTGTVQARSRLQANAARGLTRFVGRDRELEHLAQALERAGAGHGQAVAVVGEAGVGKSRLVWELTRSHRTHGWLVLEGGSVSYGKATPYLPVIELLKAYCRIQERDDPRAIRERVAGKILMLDRTLEPLLTPLLALLDVPVDDAAWHALDPPQRRQRTLEAVKRLLLWESQVQPLLVLCEDLHWIDAETQALLDSLMESLPTARVLLLVSYRPEYQHAWGGKSYYLQLRIDPLPPASAEELLNALLGEDPTLERLKRVLIARTEGNPFFLEESVRTLVETQVLAGEGGAYRMMKAPELWQIPATAQAILAARIDRLAPEDKRLLQAASVIGKDVPFALLQTIADVPEESLGQGLTRLQAAEFLYETSRFPDLEYTFKHALTHDVAYQSLLHERRRGLHARIVGALETLFPGRLDEQVDQLAHHASEAQAWEKAARYCRWAGERAAGRSAHREAVLHFERALTALRHLPEDHERLQSTIDLRFALRTALLPLGYSRRIAECLREAEPLAVALGDQRRLGRLRAYMTNYFYMAGDQVRALELGHEALAIAERLGDQPLRVETHYRLGQIYYTLGDYPRAVEVLERSVESVPGEQVHERFDLPALPAVIARTWLVQALAERGEFGDAMRRADEAVRLAEAADHPYTLAFAYWGAGGVLLSRGDIERATAMLERGLGVCETWSIALWRPRFASSLGLAYARGQRASEGVRLLEDAFEHATAAGVAVDRALFAVALCEGYLRAGWLPDAARLGRMAVELAEESGQRGREGWARWLLGEVLARADSPDLVEAANAYRTALAPAESLGMRPLLAHCHLGFGKLYRRTGKRDQAQEHLTTAMTMYREMDMRFWLEQAEAGLSKRTT